MNLNLSELSIHDVRTAISKVKNVVLNYTELEGKVREATNGDPWGASSTLMSEISNATHDYQGFNEIMPQVYKRFVDGRERNWRHGYKALTLLEYLLKNGSERVVDYARDHTYDLRAMSNFHHVDEKGKDQGINVRHRAKLIMELINDTEKLRAERKTARDNRAKYSGMSSTLSSSGFGTGSTSSRDYSSSYSTSRYPGTYAQRSTSSNGPSFRDHAPPSSQTPSTGQASRRTSASSTPSQKHRLKPRGLLKKDVSQKHEHDDKRQPAPPEDDDGFGEFQGTTVRRESEKHKQQEANLLDFDDASPAPVGSGNADDDDEWGDFVGGNSAAPCTTKSRASPPRGLGGLDTLLAGQGSGSAKKAASSAGVGEDLFPTPSHSTTSGTVAVSTNFAAFPPSQAATNVTSPPISLNNNRKNSSFASFPDPIQTSLPTSSTVTPSTAISTDPLSALVNLDNLEAPSTATSLNPSMNAMAEQHRQSARAPATASSTSKKTTKDPFGEFGDLMSLGTSGGESAPGTTTKTDDPFGSLI